MKAHQEQITKNIITSLKALSQEFEKDIALGDKISELVANGYKLPFDDLGELISDLDLFFNELKED